MKTKTMRADNEKGSALIDRATKTANRDIHTRFTP